MSHRHHQSRNWGDPREQQRRSHHHQNYHPEQEEEEPMRIPKVILVPKIQCRVTSTMKEHYQELSNGGLSPPVIAVTKPWKVDMARKTYGTNRRFQRPNARPKGHAISPSSPPSITKHHHHYASTPTTATTRSVATETTRSPNTSADSPYSSADSPELSDNSWNRDDGYPSDEENGFGGGGRPGRGRGRRDSRSVVSEGIGKYRRYHGLQAFRESPIYQKV